MYRARDKREYFGLKCSLNLLMRSINRAAIGRKILQLHRKIKPPCLECLYAHCVPEVDNSLCLSIDSSTLLQVQRMGFASGYFG